TLFDRKTRQIALTKAGEAFVAAARQSMAHAERAVERGCACSRGDTGVLYCGCSPWFLPSVLVASQSALAERLPETRLVLRSAYSSEQIRLLLEGTKQAGVVELPIEAD